LENLWQSVFRVLDDIQEDVIKAASVLSVKVANLTKRLV
jgi:hypothetical protein